MLALDLFTFLFLISSLPSPILLILQDPTTRSGRHIPTTYSKMWSVLRVLLTTTLNTIRSFCSSGFVFYGTILLNLGNYLQGVETFNASTGLELLDILFFAADDVTTDGLLLVFVRRVPIVLLTFAVLGLLLQACRLMRHIVWVALVLSCIVCLVILRSGISLWRLGSSACSSVYGHSRVASERLQARIHRVYPLVGLYILQAKQRWRHLQVGAGAVPTGALSSDTSLKVCTLLRYVLFLKTQADCLVTDNSTSASRRRSTSPRPLG